MGYLGGLGGLVGGFVRQLLLDMEKKRGYLAIFKFVKGDRRYGPLTEFGDLGFP